MDYRKLFLLAGYICFAMGCKTPPKNELLTASFSLGNIKFIHQEKPAGTGKELTLFTRFELGKKRLNAEASTYFQYQLGKKIRLVIDNDTIESKLFYYVPLISENEKEIDAKFLISMEDAGKTKQIIIQDSLFELNKINTSFK